MSTPSYSCSQSALYQVGRNVLQSLTNNLSDFSAFKAKYAALYVTAANDEITTAELLPDFQSRSAQSEVDYNNLSTQLTTCTNLWQSLKRYIIAAYSPLDQKARLEEAGANHYEKAANKNWDEARALLLSAKTFLAAHSAALLANQNMPATFEATFGSEQATFATLLTTFQQSEEQIKVDTDNKIIANNNIFAKLSEICLDGQQIFKSNQPLKDQFTFSTVLTIVSGVGTTGFKGYVMDQATTLPIAGVTITAPSFTHNYVTDANGYYEVLQIPAGIYNIVFAASGYNSVNYPAYQVDSGITHNLSATLIPIPTPVDPS